MWCFAESLSTSENHSEEKDNFVEESIRITARAMHWLDFKKGVGRAWNKLIQGWVLTGVWIVIQSDEKTSRVLTQMYVGEKFPWRLRHHKDVAFQVLDALRRTDGV